MVSVQYITETGGGQERTEKLKSSVGIVCTSVKVLKIRKMVNKMGATSGFTCLIQKWKLEGGGTTSFYFAIS